MRDIGKLKDVSNGVASVGLFNLHQPLKLMILVYPSALYANPYEPSEGRESKNSVAQTLFSAYTYVESSAGELPAMRHRHIKSSFCSQNPIDSYPAQAMDAATSEQ
ncbi:hypothetical protein E2P81_ATG08271 [Venturia nashicola]|uniref:Uncharacterized protein n=1 Tax=Venturia nashicola TaxID=86259 RepID=A0A4Z1P3H6_9PEZI|nr:hypothetical protein E6O75_ATG08451 [Venturia nashicola]TLD21683.1 hypothetical protein E2P81_ATG08271 [Venturia nashicola]